jgi:phosphatidate cytidylyltransferase
MASLLMSLAYCSLLFGGMLMMVRSDNPHQFDPHQVGWLLLPMVVIFSGDTGAYFAGRTLGRRKLAPRVSPGKTWEGAIGGLISSLVGGFVAHALLAPAYLPPMSPAQVVLLALPGAVLGQFGDLVESMMKRSVGAKDSGTLIYGHGGVLDRLDALIFAAPYFAAIRYYLHLS